VGDGSKSASALFVFVACAVTGRTVAFVFVIVPCATPDKVPHRQAPRTKGQCTRPSLKGAFTIFSGLFFFVNQ
jgi:hypothetical protein